MVPDEVVWMNLWLLVLLKRLTVVRVPARRCQDAFPRREEWLEHMYAEHRGLQRYRHALCSVLSLHPYVVSGQEWRAIISITSRNVSREGPCIGNMLLRRCVRASTANTDSNQKIDGDLGTEPLKPSALAATGQKIYVESTYQGRAVS